MAMMRFNRWLSSSSFSRRFFEEDLAGSGSIAIMSVSSRSPISAKVLKDDLAGLGGIAIEEVSGAASAVMTGAATTGAATTDVDTACGCLAGFVLSANPPALGKKS
jgi:hypothetical protein